MTIKLYDHPESQFSYKVRLLLSILEIPYEKIKVDLKSGEQKKDSFLALNPNGKVPTLVDGELVVWESNAILLYLGKKYSGGVLSPRRFQEETVLMQWLMFEATTLGRFMGMSRFLNFFASPEKRNPEELAKSHESVLKALKVVDHQLSKTDFLIGNLSIADIAIYAQVAIANEAGIKLNDFKSIKRWKKMIENLKGFEKFKK